MKRTITSLAFTTFLLLTAGVGSSFARSADSGYNGKGGNGSHSSSRVNSGNGSHSGSRVNRGNDNVNEYFRKDFRQAEIMTSVAGDNYTRITFRMNGMILTAYYSRQGDLLAVTHNITSNQLPLSLLLQLKRDYSDYWISDLFEFNAGDQSSYYLTVENADKKITLRSADGGWLTFSKTTKE